MVVCTLYIGQQSVSLGPDQARTRAIQALRERFPSFTVLQGEGWFEGACEPLLLARIATARPEEALAVAAALRSELEQESIGFECLGRFWQLTARSSLDDFAAAVERMVKTLND
jgi:hypothetical protein